MSRAVFHSPNSNRMLSALDVASAEVKPENETVWLFAICEIFNSCSKGSTAKVLVSSTVTAVLDELVTKPVLPFIMNDISSIDIDKEIDLLFAEFCINNTNKNVNS